MPIPCRSFAQYDIKQKAGKKMEAYTGFASVYDMFMDNIPYEEWCEYIVDLLDTYGVEKESMIADLGCGTGKITELLSKHGYDMIGIDNAEEMLSIAREKQESDKAETFESNILYLQQDMCELELYQQVDAMVSVCDSMNYITEKEDLLKVFQGVNKYLQSGGVFIFDLKTEYMYRDILGEQNISENREDASFIWENYYYPEEKINEYDLTIYAKQENGLYARLEETHYQRAYALEEVQELIVQSGLKFLAAYDAFTREVPKADSERIYIVAGK